MKSDQEIIVSVICTAYNQEKYIRRCLSSLVSQKTFFQYEILVHDDASTDGTAIIIKEFEHKYPGIIKPIYQSENQYSKKKRVTIDLVYPLAKGKYIAFCEGDDYWADPNKLQKQYEALEANQTALVCLHKVRVVSEDGTYTDKFRPLKKINTGIIPKDDFVKLLVFPAPNRFMQFQLTSYFIKTEAYRSYISGGELLRSHFDVGDLPLLLYLATISDAYYIDEEMSHYRLGATGSWNNRNRSQQKICQHYLIEADGLAAFNEYSKYKYEDSVRLGILSHQLKCADTQGEMSKTQYRDFMPVIRQLPFRSRLRLFLMAFFPDLLKLYYSLCER